MAAAVLASDHRLSTYTLNIQPQLLLPHITCPVRLRCLGLRLLEEGLFHLQPLLQFLRQPQRLALCRVRLLLGPA